MKKSVHKVKNLAFTQGVSLINLLIVVAVITITLTMIIPTYSDYSIRFKTKKALSVAQTAKNSIEYACLNDSSLTYLSRQVTGYKFKAIKYVMKIKFAGDCKEAIITITTQATGAQPDPVLTITGTLTGSNADFSWRCESSGLNAYTPEICQS